MKIAIGSVNPAKVKAVEEACKEQDIDVIITPMSVPSGVSNQPFSDEETIQGAVNRATNCLLEENIEIGIGLEGGVVETPFGLFVCNWGALVVKGESPIIAGGARIRLPEDVAERLRKGEELGPVMEDVSKVRNVSKKEGAIGIFTNNVITRDEMFTHVMKILIGQFQFRKK
ncbi:DUF84 family protein [Heyndrickxia oleronia]|uniref:Probable inosine/xanthosine triphosphatase n=1 Tax=Heyndrickxia oleronia TaxID=38875 RepID=A0A8E2IAA8_9BACI|nr:DUF84 family protein [Heyndrickxia oleronia]NYV64281.1 DUF84 family protein [Bacillus sp. Gen3]OJH17359.1 inosine/xanthosine triphosphatase [Bacillus obstructivus]MBU5212613.1 DUF84 family protein [Heyndrickxia oleronia]MCM3456018.1 DUF84 family protein [Heyndrickxia oleronia]MEC1374090.1 DUF84 family protein [Heyndrickxia oleronia]